MAYTRAHHLSAISDMATMSDIEPLPPTRTKKVLNNMSKAKYVLGFLCVFVAASATLNFFSKKSLIAGKRINPVVKESMNAPLQIAMVAPNTGKNRIDKNSIKNTVKEPQASQTMQEAPQAGIQERQVQSVVPAGKLNTIAVLPTLQNKVINTNEVQAPSFVQRYKGKTLTIPKVFYNKKSLKRCKNSDRCTILFQTDKGLRFSGVIDNTTQKHLLMVARGPVDLVGSVFEHGQKTVFGIQNVLPRSPLDMP
ncbi:MAG: hypothetical protein R3B45_13280 [Bdellovibrionota bacterium]